MTLSLLLEFSLATPRETIGRSVVLSDDTTANAELHGGDGNMAIFEERIEMNNERRVSCFFAWCRACVTVTEEDSADGGAVLRPVRSL